MTYQTLRHSIGAPPGLPGPHMLWAPEATRKEAPTSRSPVLSRAPGLWDRGPALVLSDGASQDATQGPTDAWTQPGNLGRGRA